MNTKTILAILLTTIFIIGAISPSVSAATLTKEDFLEEEFDKTVDFFDYARSFAANNSLSTPAGFNNYHAYAYMTYVNTSGLHLLYAGLDNITFGGGATFRIPMQSFIMHYKTNNRTRDVVLSSTFLMLMAFSETVNTIYDDSPDRNDTLWASFSMGFDLSALNATLPVLNSRTEITRLAHSDDKLQWSWGMTYTNLTAFWFQTWIDPANPRYSLLPAAITVYDTLAFTYNLTIDPSAKTATLTENHDIGQMRDLLFWNFTWIHYNSTGKYSLGAKISNDTIHDFLDDNGIKMSIVNFQTSVVADHETYCKTATGTNVTEAEIPVSDTSVATYADDGEKISSADFGAKKTYNLFNYTEDPTETNYSTYDANIRTTKRAGYIGDGLAGLFTYHLALMKFLPLVVVHMYPGMFLKAVGTIANMSRANYFYVVAYPTYSGYRVEHDPTLTVYLTTSTSTPTETPEDPARPFLGVLLVGGAIAAVIILAVLVVKLRKKPQSPTTAQPLQPPTT